MNVGREILSGKMLRSLRLAIRFFDVRPSICYAGEFCFSYSTSSFSKSPSSALSGGDSLHRLSFWRKMNLKWANYAESPMRLLQKRSCDCGSTWDPPEETEWPTSLRSAWTCLRAFSQRPPAMNPYALKRAWGNQITFWGCLGSQDTIPFAPPDEIRQEIRRLRSHMGKGGGYILAPAKPLRPETPTENAVAVVEKFLAG